MRFLQVILAGICLSAGAHAATLPADVVKALKQARIPLSAVGIEVREVNASTPILSVNAKQPMNPASTMKLLTTYAGLEILGPAHTWKTEAFLGGRLEKGVLYGDLIFKGSGNPKLTLEQFWLWLNELQDRGLSEIRGNLVLDRSTFETVPHDPAAFDNDPIRPYNMGPDALLLNFNALRLRFIPDGQQIKVVSEPKLSGIVLDNRLNVAAVQGECSNWEDAISVRFNHDALLLKGAFPVQCGEREQYYSLMSHTKYVYAVFRALWQEMGGKLSGTAVAGELPVGAILFSTHTSAPLSELIRDINKFSNNVMARQLFLSLGADAGPASISRSEQAMKNWLESKKLRFPELVLENGAGLSRLERISSHNMAMLLQKAQQSPLSAEFEASLPIIGVDGTLKKRLNGSSASNHAHLKTGSLEGVKAVAGYVQSRSGKQWVMVFLINHPNASAGQQAQDALIEWLQRR